MPLNAFKMPTTRAEEADERSRRTDGGESREAALHFGVDDGDGALETALGGVDDVGVRNLLRSRLEFGEAGGDYLGNVGSFLLRSAMAMASSSLPSLRRRQPAARRRATVYEPRCTSGRDRS